MSHSFFFILSMALIYSSFCANNFCYYRKTSNILNQTDENYLKTYSDLNEKKQQCFSLSNSDVNNNLCCFKKADNTCVEYDETLLNSGSIECPKDTKITNNCGLARYYQPMSSDVCTEISLVDGYCCFVQTKNYGNACVRQSEIDEDEKNKITDDVQNYVDKFKENNIDTKIEKVVCDGYYLKYYEIFFLLLAVML